MAKPIIEVENISKLYRLGVRGSTTLSDSIERSWYRIRGKEQMLQQIGARHLMIEPDDPQAGPVPNTLWALKDISFSVRSGEVIGIIGRNGAGKTTLLKILSQITEPTSGQAIMRGRVSSLLEVGTGFHPELTGRENIYLNGAILGMRKTEMDRKFDEIVAFSEIEKFIYTPVKRYSSGMYVRLAFAVAAHMEPEILLVDEVLAVGDIEFQKKCLGKMEDVGKQGRTVLVISHNMASILNICQRAILLNKGKLVVNGRAADVIHEYLAITRSTGGQVTWPDSEQAPGNNIVRLLAVRVLQDGIEGSTADVDISKEILIQIEYLSLQEGVSLYPAILLKDNTGVDVFSSHNATSVSLTKDPWYGTPHPRGLFRSTCRIPGDFFNSGIYSITAILGQVPGLTIVWKENILSFQVHETGEVYQPGGGRWSGVVRPRLAWHTEHIGSTVFKKET